MERIRFEFSDNRDQLDRQTHAFHRIEETVKGFRQEAIDFRRSLGIEDLWLEDEQFYEGVEVEALREDKPPTRPSIKKRNSVDGREKSSIWVNITGTYVDTAAARLADAILPDDDSSWSIKRTEIPTLVELANGDVPTDVDDVLRSKAAGAEDEAAALQESYDRVQALAKERLAQADQAAKRATKQIRDWHQSCNYRGSMRKVTDWSARIGTSVMRGPTPALRKAARYDAEADKLDIVKQVVPRSDWVDVWNCYPDPIAGENIQNGEFHFERDDISNRRLRELAEDPSYITSQILKVLGQSASTRMETRREVLGMQPSTKSMERLHDLWICYITLDSQMLTDAGATIKERGPDGQEVDKSGLLWSIPLRVVMCDDHIIQVTKNPSFAGEFPYDYFRWRSYSGLPYGQGIARMLHDIQRIVLNAARRMMENAGIAGSPMLVISEKGIRPADGKPRVGPWKIFYATEEAGYEDVAFGFRVIEIPMYQKEMEAIIRLALKLAEDITGLPVLLQGQQGAFTPDTVGGMQILQENASSPLRRQARQLDEQVTKPHTDRYYAFLLEHGDGRGGDYSKADLEVDASGSERLIQRALKEDKLGQLLNLAANPVYGIDPKRLMASYLKAQGLSILEFQYTDEEWKKIVEKMSAPPEDSAVAVAQIRQGWEELKLQMLSQDREAERELKLEIEERRRASGDRITAVKEMSQEHQAMMDQLELSDAARARMEGFQERLETFAIEKDSEFRMKQEELASRERVAREQAQARRDAQRQPEPA